MQRGDVHRDESVTDQITFWGDDVLAVTEAMHAEFDRGEWARWSIKSGVPLVATLSKPRPRVE
jgi:hypothetical protein